MGRGVAYGQKSQRDVQPVHVLLSLERRAGWAATGALSCRETVTTAAVQGSKVACRFGVTVYFGSQW